MFAGVFSVYTYIYMEVYVTDRQSLRSPLHYFGILQHQFEYRDFVNYAHCDLQ